MPDQRAEGEPMSTWYMPPTDGLPEGQNLIDAINALRTTYGEDGNGWLSTLVWNTRNNYSAWPESTFSATQVRMIVEGFLAEIAAIRSGHSGANPDSPSRPLRPDEADVD